MDLKDWITKAYTYCHGPYKVGRNYGVPEEWLVGLIRVECSSFDPSAHHREDSVLQSVTTVAQGGNSETYPGFNTGPIKQYIMANAHNAEALEPLATSYGLVQIMGYHYFMTWGLKPTQFIHMNFLDSLHYSLLFIAGNMGKAHNYEELCRLHNTGSITGATYDPNYVKNAAEAMEAYKQLLKEHG